MLLTPKLTVRSSVKIWDLNFFGGKNISTAIQRGPAFKKLVFENESKPPPVFGGKNISTAIQRDPAFKKLVFENESKPPPFLEERIFPLQ